MNIVLNSNWFFHYGQELEGNDFLPIALPHTFQLPYYGDNEFYIGYGVYKKILTFDENNLNGKIVLAFEGVFQHLEAWLNGEKIGEHFGGYTAFDLDLTNFARLGDNQLVLRVDNLWRADLPPRAGEHVFCGGIYRDVELCLLPKNHIARRGIFVHTKNISDDSTISIETEFVLNANLPQHAKFEVFYGNTCVFAEEKEISKKISLDVVIKNSKLWSPETPNLYMLRVSFGEDVQTVEFGIRTVAFDKDNGFFLNGEHYLIEGVNVHQDHGGWGDAVTRSGITRDLLLVKECGFNFVRGSHYPKHSFFAKECDRIGLLFWSEAPFWGIGGFGDDGYWNSSAMPADKAVAEKFSENCMVVVKEMIDQIKNSPSVIVWSMGNEVFFCDKSALKGAKALAENMIKYTKELDPGRPAALGGTQRGDLHKIGDVTGFNGDGATLFKAPPIPSMVSEYGSVVADRPDKGGLRYGAGTKDTPKWRAGRALWCAFHHGSIADIGKMGIIDLYRMPLNAYFDYRKELTGKATPPKVLKGKATLIKLSCDISTIGTNGLTDCMLIASYYNDKGNRVKCDNDIILNVSRGNGLFPTGDTWVMTTKNGSLANGSGAIEMRAYKPGEIIVTATANGVEKAEIKIIADGEDSCDVIYPKMPEYKKHIKQEVDVLFARPVYVSTETENATRDMANDNQSDTFWCPNENDNDVYWQVDTEGMRVLSKLSLNLGDKKHKIIVEISDDNQQWQRVYKNIFKKRFNNNILKLKKCKGRFLRIKFADTSIKAYSICAFEALD